MITQQLEVYSADSNYAVIKPPGRQYPGCVIQGDSLSALCRNALLIAKKIQSADLRDRNLLECVDEVANSLIARMLHYQRVLDAHGIDYPHVHAFSESDRVKLLPADEYEE